MNFLLHLEIAEGVAVFRARGRQVVVVTAGRELHRLHGHLGRGAADDDRKVIRRARRGPEREHLLFQEGEHAVARQDRRRRLKEKSLVGRTAAFRDEQEFVFVLGFTHSLRENLHLRRHVGLGVLLLEHGDRRELRIAQIFLQVSVARAFRERGLILPFGPNEPPLLAHDQRRAGVLAHRQHAAGGDIGVLQEVVGDEFVVIARFLVVEDRTQALEVLRPQVVVDVVKGLFRQNSHCTPRDNDELLAECTFDANAGNFELAVLRPVLAQREQRRVLVGRDRRGDGSVHGNPCEGDIFDHAFRHLRNSLKAACEHAGSNASRAIRPDPN